MTKTEEIFHKMAAEMADAKESKMFGAKCIKTPNGKAVLMVYNDNLVFKLEGDTLKEALSLDGAQLFDPMGGRPMGGWAQVPIKYADKWPDYAEKAMEYVKALK